jgi:hypothetical protein
MQFDSCILHSLTSHLVAILQSQECWQLNSSKFTNKNTTCKEEENNGGPLWNLISSHMGGKETLYTWTPENF